MQNHIDHRAFLTSLPPEVRTGLTARSDRAGLVHLAGHAGAILAVGALIAAQVPFWPLLLPVQGVLIVFLFTLEHEATHKTPFASERLNEVVSARFFLIHCNSFHVWKFFYCYHYTFSTFNVHNVILEY